MTDNCIKAKQALIQQLRTVAEKETAWLEKNRLLYTEKRSRLDSLIELRSASGGEITPEEQNLSKHVAYFLRSTLNRVQQYPLHYAPTRHVV